MENWIDTHIMLPRYVMLSDEKKNAFSHFLGLILSVYGLLAVLASGSEAPKAGMAIFALSNIVMYTASGFYHYLESGVMKKMLRVLDHSAIYILIAGSYTPLLLHVGTPLSKAFTAIIWLSAIIGIVTTLRFWGRFYPLHVALYAIMGWSIVLVWDDVIPSIPSDLFRYMLAGGIAYTSGLIFYGIRKIPHNHLIWHFFVLAGSSCFFIGYYLYLLP